MSEPKDFPLLNECVAQGSAWSLFSLMKDWDHPKFLALLKEIEAAEDHILSAWKKEAFKPVNFLFSENSIALDRAKFEANCMLTEILSVAFYYMPTLPHGEEKIVEESRIR